MDELDVTYSNEYNELFDYYKSKVPLNSCLSFNVEFFIKFITYNYFLYIKTDLKYVDIIKILSNKFNLALLLNKTILEIHQFFSEVQCKLHLNQSDDKIISRYSNEEDCNLIRKRMRVRLELYRIGWTPEKIEKYIHKYIINKEFDDNINLGWYELILINIFRKLKISRNMPMTKIGRPPLPKAVKEIINEIHQERVKDNMRLKYKQSNKYDNIKDWLFTEEEIKKIETLLNDEVIINKIRRLKKE
jgi:hypothetical protein